jgi:S-DNA-T family DNA segregation ATPase FtsK/SpoIIIE
MMLHCTLVPAPGSALAGEPVELAVAVPADCAGLHLQEAVSRRYGTGELSVDGCPLAALTVGTAPLVHGAVLVDGLPPRGPRPGAGDQEAPSLMLAVHSGPGAGTIVPLRRGSFRIGRSGTEIIIPDAELSREHARLDVSDSAVSIVDLNSVNGTTVDGRKVREGAVTTGSLIRCGSSTMSLIFGGASLQYGVPDSGTAAGSNVAEALVVGNAAAGSNRTALVLAAGLPLAIGIGLALLTGMWMFLAFTAVSAVTVLAPIASGRRQRRELKAAVAAAAGQDAERRRRAAPSAADLALHGGFGQATRPHPKNESAPLWLRLGLAEQTANIRLEPAGPGFRPPSLGLMPLMLDPSIAVTTIRGPESAVAGLVRSLIIQLAGYPLGRRTRVLIHGSPESIPLAARFLSGVTLSGHAAALAGCLNAGPGEGFDRGLLIILDGAGATPAAGTATARESALRASATNHGWQVIDCAAGTYSAGTHPVPNASIVLDGRTARLCTGRGETTFVPDLVPALAFDRYCRRLGSAARDVTAPPPAIPGVCALGEVLPLSAAGISRRWANARRTPGLPVPVGTGRSGPLMIDLQADGPHFLVAGTTGSGKSEFLRTLTAGLAASYPPDRINLLFIDFKGGSGLGPLTGLPHCVGMLTDLGTNEVERTLVSLRAEVRRREEMLAAVQAHDLAAYEGVDPALPALPHLILVIDEFRMLVEEAPGALSELMRVAAIGRSLGIHLIMATQRPQGSITADIRANVTSCVALRVQSDLESLDIMDSRLAAAIPIAKPGRAFLVRGTEAPQEFQTATLTPVMPRPAGGTVTVFSVKEFLGRPQTGAVTDEDAPSAEDAALAPAQAAAPLVEELSRLWAALGGIPPRRPVAVPLPASLPFPLAGSPGAPFPGAPSTGPGGPGMVRLGWVDVPEQQRVAELRWHPAGHGHLGLIGGVAGAGDTAVALAVDQLLSGEDEAHLYLLDAAGAFGTAATSARVGAVAGLHELRRAVRVLERIAEEVTRRLGTPAPDDPPPLVLVISGWGSWASAFRSGPQAWAEDLVHDIVRDGPKAGVAVLVSGERELVTARFFAAIPNRVFFPAGSTEESRLAWPRLPALEPVPGRAAVFGAFVAGRSSEGHRCQIFERPAPADRRVTPSMDGRPLDGRPFRVEALPPLVTVTEILARLNPDAGPTRRALRAGRSGAPGVSPPARYAANISLRIGVGGDDLLPFTVPLPGGSVLAVLGGPASGKSTLLAALPGLNPSSRDWLAPGPGSDPAQFWADTKVQALAGEVARDAILVADDVDLQSADTNRRLHELNGLGWTVIMTAGFGPALQQRVPLAPSARSLGKGILICPRSLMDGDLFGVRFELEHSPPPGRAVVISDGRAAAVQLASAQAAVAPARTGLR